ncbi:hypothetical protein D3C85_1359680 [compost metagenome]
MQGRIAHCREAHGLVQGEISAVAAIDGDEDGLIHDMVPLEGRRLSGTGVRVDRRRFSIGAGCGCQLMHVMGKLMALH